MSRSIRSLLPLAALSLLASPSHANDLAHVKCGVNQDRVWVYDSLASFNVEEQLHCGASVEILSRVTGYVKIRTGSGAEGFIPDSAFPESVLANESEKPVANPEPQSLAAQTHMPAPAASGPAEPLVAAAAKPSKPLAALAKAVSSAPAAPAPVTISNVPVPASVPVKVSAPAKPAPTAPVSVSANVSTPPVQANPATTAVKKADAAPSSPTAPSTPANTMTATPNIPVASTSLPMGTVNALRRDSAAMVPATAVPSASIEESDEDPVTQPENESADPACRVYFAAYGLTPSQYKWLAENRRQEFSGICPAPDPAHVDYVVLLTHDSDSYTFAMPTPVHTDHSGFSDFSPLTPVDTALVAASEVEKAHYEFVWVFRVTRGAFDPARFSARRRPQYTTTVKGSRAPSRAVEEAFNFVQTQGLNR